MNWNSRTGVRLFFFVVGLDLLGNIIDLVINSKLNYIMDIIRRSFSMLIKLKGGKKNPKLNFHVLRKIKCV